jgi:hypothetical protein
MKLLECARELCRPANLAIAVLASTGHAFQGAFVLMPFGMDAKSLIPGFVAGMILYGRSDLRRAGLLKPAP